MSMNITSIINKNKKLLIIKEIVDEKFSSHARILRLYRDTTLARYMAYKLMHPQSHIHPQSVSQQQSQSVSQPQASRLDNTSITTSNTSIATSNTKLHNSSIITSYIDENITSLYDYQCSILDKLSNTLLTPPHCFFLKLGTGYGKTVIAIHSIILLSKFADTNYKVLVIVPTIQIGNQWIAQCKEKGLNSGMYNNAKNIVFQVTISVVNTARSKDDAWYSQFTYCILDEVHEYVGKSNKNVLWGSGNCKYALGLSATPDTGNGLLPFIEGHIGHFTEFAVNTVNYRTIVYICNYKGDKEYTTPEVNENGNVMIIPTVQKILQDENRTTKVLWWIHRLYTMHEFGMSEIYKLRDREGNILHKHKIFVFVEFREYISILYDKLRILYEDVEVEDATTLMGGSTEDDANNASSKRIVITTHAYSKRGISYNDFTALIMVTPRRRSHIVEQLLGRIFRVNGPTEVTRMIVDIVDINTPLKHQLEDRLEVYNSKGYKVQYMS